MYPTGEKESGRGCPMVIPNCKLIPRPAEINLYPDITRGHRAARFAFVSVLVFIFSTFTVGRIAGKVG